MSKEDNFKYYKELVGKRQIYRRIVKGVEHTLATLTEDNANAVSNDNGFEGTSNISLCNNSNIALASTETVTSSSTASVLQNVSSPLSESENLPLTSISQVEDTNDDIYSEADDTNNLRGKLRSWALRNNKVPLSAI